MFDSKANARWRRHSILTPRLQFSLEAQAIKEGLLGRQEYAMGKIHPVPPNYGQPEFDRRILPYLSIFPTVTMSQSDFVLDKLKGTGLDINLQEPHRLRFMHLQDAMEPEDFERLMKMSVAEAFEIFKAQNKQLTAIIEALIVSESDHDLRHTCQRIFVNIAAFLSGFYSDETGNTPFFKALGYEEALAEVSGVPVSVINTHYFGEWLDKVDDLFVRLLISLFLGHYQEENVSVGRWWGVNSKGLIVPDGALKVWDVLIQFKEELTVMAAPRTIAEAVEFGHSRELDRLRQLLGQWLSSVGDSSPALEGRIRRDIGKASRELKRLKKWKAFNESPLVFGMKFLAGQVPVISNVVTAMDAGSWAYECWVVRRNCWVAIK